MSVPTLIEAPPTGLTLLGYWRMAAASGTSETDASGGGNAGTYSASGVSLAQPGALVGDANTAAQFDGVAGTFTAPLNLTGLSKITVVAWVKHNGSSWPVPASWGYLFQHNASTNNQMFLVRTGAAVANTLELVMRTTGSANGGITIPAFSVGQYHMLALCFDRTATTTTVNQYTVYVDGVLATKSVDSQYPSTNLATGTFSNSTLSVAAGNALSSLSPITVDELAVFSGLMTLGEVQQIYSSSQQKLAAFAYTQANARVPWDRPVTASVAATATEGSLGYAWSATLPTGSVATITGQGTSSVSVTPDLEGTYGLGCTVTDTGGNTSGGSGQTLVTAPMHVMKSDGSWMPAKAKVWNGSAFI